MTFGLALFICVFLVILGMVVVSEFTSKSKPADLTGTGLEADTGKE